MATKKNPTSARLKIDFEAACNAYLKAFCEKHDYDYNPDFWAAGDVGEIVEVSDMFFTLTDIRTDIDRNAPKDQIVAWYDYTLRLHCISPDIPKTNYRSWLMGCPRQDETWFEQMEKLHQAVEGAKKNLEECIKQEGF